MVQSSQPHSLPVLCCRRQRGFAIAVAVAAVWAAGGGSLPPLLARAAAEGPAEQARLPELVRTKHRTFSIPFRLPTAKDADAAPQRVMMSVSKDLGGTWEPAGEVAPSAGTFTYQAGADGEYWFRLRAIDRKGRARGGEGADMRVLVDAAGPRLAARVWKGADGEILCRYAAIDDSIRMESLKLEYRTTGAQGWKTVAAEGVLSRESPAHLVGEEIWWAGEKVDELTARITVSDSAGNQTVRQFRMEPTDPNIDQTALAQELGAPSLPAQESPQQTAMPRPVTQAFTATDGSRSAAGWNAETAAAWSAEQPRGAPAGNADRVGDPQSVLVSRMAGSASSASSKDSAGGRSLLASTSAGMPAQMPPQMPGAAQPLEYRGKPLQLSRSRRFAWDYEVPAERPNAPRLRIELWSTRDGGLSWQKTAVDDDALSPINVVLPAAGLYGFRLEIVPDVPDSSTGPRPGDAAESWIGVDEDLPHVELLGATRFSEGETSGILIRYTSRDQLPAPKTARVLFSPNADGPWATVATALDNQGEYRWQPDQATPARVYLRIEVSDAAGNVGAATSPEPLTVATSRVVGRLGSVRTLPTAP
jgi:hypothetical protein